MSAFFLRRDGMKTLCLSNFCILSGRWKVDYFFLCLNSFGEWQNWENLSFTLVFQINYLEIERKVISRIFRNIKNNPILARNAKRTKNPWDFNQFAINQNASSFSWKIIFFIPGENKFPRLHRLNVKGFLFGKLQKNHLNKTKWKPSFTGIYSCTSHGPTLGFHSQTGARRRKISSTIPTFQKTTTFILVRQAPFWIKKWKHFSSFLL